MHFSLPRPALCLSLASLFAAPLYAATWQWDGGAGTGNWQTPANWDLNAANTNFNGTFPDRLNVNGTQALTYSAAEGTTLYGTTGIRGVVIGSGTSAGAMLITGGTFSVANANAADVIGNTAISGATSSLTISGGIFISSSGGMQNNFGGTNQNAIITVSGTGSATFTTLTVSNAGGGTGTVNLDGGTLAANLLNKAGTGTAIVNLNGGTLQARQNNTTFMAGLNQANVKAGGALIDTNTFDITIGQSLLDGTGGGGLTKANTAGVLTLTGTNTYTGTTTINAGTLQIGAGATTGTLGTGAVVNNAALTVNRSNAYSFGAGISGSGVLNKSGAGVFSLNGANGYTGATNILAGAILINANDGLGTTAGGTVVSNNAALALGGGVNYTSTEALTITGPGLTGADAYFVGSAVQRGSLTSVTGANIWNGNISISGTNTRIGVQDGASLTINGTITESVAGTTMHFRGGNTAGSDILINSTGNSWTGETHIFSGGGAIKLGVNNALATAALLRVGTTGILGNTIFDLNGFNQTAAGLSQVGGSAAIVTNNGASPSTLNLAPTAVQTFTAVINDGTSTVAIDITGPSGQIFTGASNYSGGTTVTGGTLLANNTTGSATGSGNVSVLSGATLGGTGTISGSVTTAAGSFLSPGASIESLEVGGASGSGRLIIEFDGSAGTPIDLLDAIGSLNISTMTVEFDALGSPLTAPAYVFASYGTLTGSQFAAEIDVPAGYQIDYNYNGLNDIALVAIPEASSPALLIVGGAGFFFARHRKR